MTQININRDNEVFTIDIPEAQKFDDWYIRTEESSRISREDFVFDKFVEDWPDIRIPTDVSKGYQRIGSLASRSIAIRDWLAAVNTSYVLEAAVPNYYKKRIPNDEYVKLQQDMTSYSKEIVLLNIKNNAALDIYKASRDKNQKEFENKTKKFSENKLFEILNITTEKMPPEIHNLLEEYTPVGEGSPTMRDYAREIFIRFKLFLVDQYNLNKDIKITEFLTKFSGKPKG